jgi:YVTN family beta-propeller protein
VIGCAGLHPRGLLLVLAAALALAPAAPARAGALTPGGWRVEPVGDQFGPPPAQPGFQGPLGSALSPDGSRMLSVSSGAARLNSADLFDVGSRRRVASLSYDAVEDPGQGVFYGVVFSPDGLRAWASGGGQDVVHAYAVEGDRLRETGTIAVPGFPAGLAYGRTPQGDRIYVANNLSGPGIEGNPPGRSVTVIDPATNAVTGTIYLGAARQPLDVTFERTGRKAYVTNWMGRSVSVVDTALQWRVRDVLLSPRTRPLQADHPSAIAANPVRNEVYTANANSDTVSVIRTTRPDRLVETIDVRLSPIARPGASPSGVAVSPDGRTLYVSLAGENAVAVVDLDSRRVRGFVPTAWYPTDVEVTPDGGTLVVTNLNGTGPQPNHCGPLSPRPDCPPKDPDRDDPGQRPVEAHHAATMTRGAVTTVPLPLSGARLRELSATVRANNRPRRRPAGRPRWLRRIKHVIYVVKENRTYDQVLGDLGKGDGDPSLTVFGESVAPNHRELARRFVLFDRFFADAEVSADGQNWATGAGASDYVEKTWPVAYSPNPRGRQRDLDFTDVPFSRQFSSEPLASEPGISRSAAAQTSGYLWDNAYDHGVRFRNYGLFTQLPGSCDGFPNISHTTRLAPRYSTVAEAYPGFNLECSDHVHRLPQWEREFRRFERARHRRNRLPPLSLVWLPNDHTRGTVPGAPTPQAYMADNDLALGRLVEVVSNSRYWRRTLILVTEDDAQNGPDHVDAHRTVSLAISPYTQTGRVDSTHYDTASMIATIEDLLGLPPMTIADQRATRLWRAFSRRPNLTPYFALQPQVVPFGQPGAPVNGPGAPLAAASARWNFEAVDDTPELELNQAIWKSVKGRGSRMPAPRHDLIVGSLPTEE